MTFNNNTLTYMAFDALVLIIIALCVYLKLIPNDLLLVGIGAIVMHGFGIIPTSTAISTNTSALKENTTATIASAQAVALIPTAAASPAAPAPAAPIVP